MRPLVVVGTLLTVCALALALMAFGPATSPAAPASSARTPLSSARLFMLLPDGKVEVSDPWGRRLYRWDGRQWVELQPAKTLAAIRPAPAR